MSSKKPSKKPSKNPTEPSIRTILGNPKLLALARAGLRSLDKGLGRRQVGKPSFGKPDKRSED